MVLLLQTTPRNTSGAEISQKAQLNLQWRTMENQSVSGGRLTGIVRRWRKRPAQAETAQESFFPPLESTATSNSATVDAFPPLKPSPVHKPLPEDPELTPDQAEALRNIEAAFEPGSFYLLTGHAGTGKTYLMQRLTKNMMANKRRVILSAPTHKAVTVLARKLAEAKIEGVACRTIHSVLSLKAKPQTDRLVFQRDRGAEPVTADVVVVDECSMVDEDLFRHIKRHLPNAFVLFVGDPAQLPPVGEADLSHSESIPPAHDRSSSSRQPDPRGRRCHP